MKILLATDGSKTAQAAEAVASRFPFGSGIELHVTTVAPVADLTALAPTVPMAVNDIVDRCRADAQKLLDEVAQRCRQWATRVTQVLLDGHPAQELIKLAEKIKPDVMVVGARGLGAVSRVMLGSVSERVAKYAPCSVLVVRHTAQAPETRKILIGCDDSPGAQQVIHRFASLPLGAERSVKLHTIVETLHIYGADIGLQAEAVFQREIEHARARLSDAASLIRQATPHVTTQVEQATDVADRLIQVAQDDGDDLIAVGSTGKNRWERFLLGSVSIRLLHHAPCSVWIERSP